MADRKNKNKNIMWELPPEILLFQILPKLPAKYLLRFKCVCKQWRSFLTTPMFTKIQLHHATHHSHEKLLFLNSFPLSWNFRTIDCEGGSISTPRSYPFRGAAAIITSFVNGLVCVGIRGQPFELSDVILWNPLTGEYKTISRPIGRKSYNFRSMRFELYYTCNDDDYKILLLSRACNVYIYSLKFDSWRMVESTYDSHEHERIPYAVDHNMLDEKLHYLWQRKRSFIIIRLDLKTEKLTKIAVPSTGRHGCLRVVRGCIQLTFYEGQCGQWTIEVWQMDGDGDWTKLANTSSSYHIRKPLTGSSIPLYVTRNGNWVVQGTSNIICKVDPEKNTIGEIMCSNYNIFIHRRGTYIETLVSPNQYVN